MPESGLPVREMIAVREAREEILSSCGMGAVEQVALSSAVGRVLRGDVVADIDIPPFDNSAMDGFAVSLSDLSDDGGVLHIHEDVPAGSWPTLSVGAGRCARIMTGAPIPAGTDAVVPIEWCEGAMDVGGSVTVRQRPAAGQHVRKRGSDIRAGDVAIRSPFEISPLTIGLLASLGYSKVSVSRRPSVSIVVTGDELVDVSERPKPGQIRDSNGPTLAALTEASGAVFAGLYVARDNLEDACRVLKDALAADIVIVSGGVSVGSYDFIKEALDRLGMQLHFWRVRQRPGKPMTFGTIGERLIFGLPGNPVSTSVCYQQYVRPAIRKMLGLRPGPHLALARLSDPITKHANLHYFVPGLARSDAEGNLVVDKSGTFGSHIFSTLAAGNCLISLPEGPESLDAGALVEIELFDVL